MYVIVTVMSQNTTLKVVVSLLLLMLMVLVLVMVMVVKEDGGGGGVLVSSRLSIHSPGLRRCRGPPDVLGRESKRGCRSLRYRISARHQLILAEKFPDGRLVSSVVVRLNIRSKCKAPPLHSCLSSFQTGGL